MPLCPCVATPTPCRGGREGHSEMIAITTQEARGCGEGKVWCVRRVEGQGVVCEEGRGARCDV